MSIRLLALAALTFTLTTCTEPAVSDPTNPDGEKTVDPTIFIKSVPEIPAEGSVDGVIGITIVNLGESTVETECDGEVILTAEYTGDGIHFTAAENPDSEMRTGTVKILAGNAQRTVELTQRAHLVYKYTGWAELPSTGNREQYEHPLVYYAHDRLPSNPSLRNYSFCYCPDHIASLWVAYPLHECYMGDADRTNKFNFDYDFADYTSTLGLGGTEWQSDIKDYAYYPQNGSANSHSRGHQMPSADRTASREDNLTTFYATNMTPQLQSLNGGAWEGLEELERKWICPDTLYIVTGPVFDDGYGYAYDERGKGKAVSVPTRYWKIFLRTKDGNTGKALWECDADEMQCIGFIFNHDTTRSSKAVYNSDALTVSDLERITGFDFFVNVPNAPKAAFDTSLWPGLKE